MPELPEVEITRRGLAPRLVGRRVRRVVVRQARLRWPVPRRLGERLAGQTIEGVGRRAKYLLLRTSHGTVILHLGMSGSLLLVDAGRRPGPHDHLDLVLSDGQVLRLRDPRRFGAVLWTRDNPEAHPLIRELGPEPLGDAFDGDYLRRVAGGRRGPVKGLLMNGRVVVGIGNIYANEALFRAGIHPFRRSGRISAERYRILAEAIRTVLTRAIARGGTTLRDFVRETGEPGRFRA
jgi:formamidopyrimidine-DNA glycosylase